MIVPTSSKTLYVVGAGLFGATVANIAHSRGYDVTVFEKRYHIAGNIYTEEVNGIQVHKYGPHIFHTNSSVAWNYVNSFAAFNNYINSPLANYYGSIYNLPFNMNTFHQLWGVTTPQEARLRIDRQRRKLSAEPKNLEEFALSTVGTDIYYALIKEYTEKQWGKSCTELPPDILKRIPLRFTYDNNYFNSMYQGIPIEGYTSMVENMLEGVKVVTNTSYNDVKNSLEDGATVIYTGPIDEFFGYVFGELEYRSLEFVTSYTEQDNVQGTAVMNMTSKVVPYTRRIEHRHFNPTNVKGSVITYEYPKLWQPGMEPYYPVGTERNTFIYRQYVIYAQTVCPNIIFCGRLGSYTYADMDKTVLSAMELCDRIL